MQIYCHAKNNTLISVKCKNYLEFSVPAAFLMMSLIKSRLVLANVVNVAASAKEEENHCMWKFILAARAPLNVYRKMCDKNNWFSSSGSGAF